RGSHAELMQAGGCYARLFDRQEGPPTSTSGINDDQPVVEHHSSAGAEVGNRQPSSEALGNGRTPTEALSVPQPQTVDQGPAVAGLRRPITMDPFVFLVGCARSGTTLLQRIVDAHPRIAITPELHWITDHSKNGKWMAPEGRVTPDLLAALAE